MVDIVGKATDDLTIADGMQMTARVLRPITRMSGSARIRRIVWSLMNLVEAPPLPPGGLRFGTTRTLGGSYSGPMYVDAWAGD